MDIFLYIAIVFMLIFTCTNGMKDGANVMATAIASRSLTRGQAMLIVTLSELIGPFLLGTMVAHTVAENIINVQLLDHSLNSLFIVLGGILGAIAWNTLTWWLKLPTSSSFTLVGGLIGPPLYRFGLDAVPWGVFSYKVILAMFLSPLLGILFGYLIYKIGFFLLRDSHFQTNKTIKKLQIVSLIFMGANHGTNDSQKSMGIIALLLYISGNSADFHIPFWVKLASVLAITFGITIGGTKIIKTVGYGLFRIRPYHSLESQISSTLILFFCNRFGAPVSTTQIVSSSVIGVGSGFRKKSVRWGIIKEIFYSWILTIPCAGLMGILFYIVLQSAIHKGG